MPVYFDIKPKVDDGEIVNKSSEERDWDLLSRTSKSLKKKKTSVNPTNFRDIIKFRIL